MRLKVISFELQQELLRTGKHCLRLAKVINKPMSRPVDRQVLQLICAE